MNWDPTIEISARLTRDGSGDYYCPAHDDETASLSCNPGDDGRVLLKCHRRPPCSTEEIVTAIGLTLRDLFPRDGERSKRRKLTSNPPRRRAAAKPRRVPAKELLVEPIELRDAAGRYIVTQLRVTLDSIKSNGTRRKKFSYRYQDGRRCTLDSLGLTADTLPLWHSERLKHPDRIVIICEGAKAARALINALARAALGDAFVVLATVAGAEVTPCAERLDCLRERVVWLWPDNDDGGRAHMADLECWAPAAEMRTIMIDGLPEGGDAADYFKAGGTILQMLGRAARHGCARAARVRRASIVPR